MELNVSDNRVREQMQWIWKDGIVAATVFAPSHQKLNKYSS